MIFNCWGAILTVIGMAPLIATPIRVALMEPELKYIGGDVQIVEDFDMDFLSIINVKDVYKKKNWVLKMLSMCMC